MNTINSQALHSLLKSKPKDALFLDVRTPAEYRTSHIEGTINIPLDKLKSEIETLKEYKKIYINCGTGNRSGQACKYLKKEGLENLINIEGGLQSWEAAKLPLVKGKKSISIMRQVQITAGTLILLGVLLGHFYLYDFIWLSGFVGAGLLFAGLSGTCAMARLLSIMPWNR